MSKMPVKNMLKATSLLTPLILWGCVGGAAMVTCQASGFAPGQPVIVNIRGGKQLTVTADGNGVVTYQVSSDIGCPATTPIDPSSPNLTHQPIQN